MHIFIPGRICLFGEHSDWAGGYRKINTDLEKGYTIIAGTNQGLYANVEPHPCKLIIRATLDDGRRMDIREWPMQKDVLLEEAKNGGFYSYAAGVVFRILSRYPVPGLIIDNYRTNLPIKKGLSSSAAICVLVARAFNHTYDLRLSVREEMEYAYQGEIAASSFCGRMDQGCACGTGPVLMTFDGDCMDMDELKVRVNLFYVLVDLKATKDTKEILRCLNGCYPFASDDVQARVQYYLGKVNKRIVREAAAAMEAGNAEQVGSLMNEAQADFDACIRPACPEHLSAPVLHRLLAYPRLRPYLYGGKGVGSQGDGSAQLLAKDAESRDKVIGIIESDLNMSCLRLDIKPNDRIDDAERISSSRPVE